MLTAVFVIWTLRFRNIKWLLNVVSEVKRVLRQLWTLQMLTGLLIFAIAPDKRQILLVFMSPHRHLWGGGQLDFGADPLGIGIGISMTLSCLHNILWTSDLEKLNIQGGGGVWREGQVGTSILSENVVTIFPRGTFFSCFLTKTYVYWGACNENLQNMFLVRNKKNIYSFCPPPFRRKVEGHCFWFSVGRGAWCVVPSF